MSSPFHLRLSRAEALVLFDWLARRAEEEIAAAEKSGVAISSDAASIALRRLHGYLERTLDEAFDKEYAQLLASAKRSLEGR